MGLVHGMCRRPEEGGQSSPGCVCFDHAGVEWGSPRAVGGEGLSPGPLKAGAQRGSPGHRWTDSAGLRGRSVSHGPGLHDCAPGRVGATGMGRPEAEGVAEDSAEGGAQQEQGPGTREGGGEGEAERIGWHHRRHEATASGAGRERENRRQGGVTPHRDRQTERGRETETPPGSLGVPTL
jgi:hypothetical protein